MPSTGRRVAAPLRCQALRQQSPPKPTSPASAAGCAKRDPMQAHAPLRPHIWLPLATTRPKSWTKNAMDFRSPPHRAMARALQDRGHWRYPGFPVGLWKPFWLVSCGQFFGPIFFGPTPADFFGRPCAKKPTKKFWSRKHAHLTMNHNTENWPEKLACNFHPSPSPQNPPSRRPTRRPASPDRCLPVRPAPTHAPACPPGPPARLPTATSTLLLLLL